MENPETNIQVTVTEVPKEENSNSDSQVIDSPSTKFHSSLSAFFSKSRSKSNSVSESKNGNKKNDTLGVSTSVKRVPSEETIRVPSPSMTFTKSKDSKSRYYSNFSLKFVSTEHRSTRLFSSLRQKGKSS